MIQKNVINMVGFIPGKQPNMPVQLWEDDCQLIIVNHNVVDEHHIANWLEQSKCVIDTVGVGQLDSTAPGYEGVAW